MTDAKKPTITMPDLKRDREDESNALYVMRLVQQPVLPQDAYSPNEVARLLNSSKKRVYDYASSPRHPLPLRKWPNGARGSVSTCPAICMLALFPRLHDCAPLCS